MNEDSRISRMTDEVLTRVDALMAAAPTEAFKTKVLVIEDMFLSDRDVAAARGRLSLLEAELEVRAERKRKLAGG